MKRLFTLLMVAVIALASIACSDPSATRTISVNGGSYMWLTPAQFNEFISDESVYLINVDEVYAGEIKRGNQQGGTNLFLGASKISANLDKMPSDKATKIAVYCANGLSSQDGAALLVKAGYTNVAELNGGLAAWNNQGYQSITKASS